MNAPDPLNESAESKAARDLASAQAKVAAARAVLAGLLQDVALAESRLSNSQAAQLVEANEQLVFAALRNQTVAESATQALVEATRSAELDPLTQLPNRIRLLDRFGQGAALAKRHGGRMAFLFIDLDEFKQINDNLGHAVGDQALILAAKRLASAVRDADTVSRHGGDEFLVLLTEVSQRSDAVLIAGKLLAALASPIHLGDQELRLNASIGISIYPDDGEEVKTLIHLADAAMYRVKRRGLGGVSCHGDDPAVDGRA